MRAPKRAAAQRLALWAAAALLGAGSGVFAAAAELGEGPARGVRLPSAPLALPAQASIAPSLAAPSFPVPAALSLPPAAVSVRLAAGSPSADPHAAGAPRPAGASAGLQSVARALAQEQAQAAAPGAAGAEAAPSRASRAFFDGALGKTVKTGAVLASAAVPGGAAMPSVYALARYSSERASRPQPEPAPLGRRLAERAESHLALLAMAVPAFIAHAFVANGMAATLIAVLMALGSAAGMETLLGDRRNRVVGGWQASHDQRYRVDPSTGVLKDVRGHKYGEDRYEERQPGPVGAGERLWMRLVSAGAGALLVAAWPGASALLYGAALSAAWLISDARADRRPAAQRVFSAEERAHAARFRH